MLRRTKTIVFDDEPDPQPIGETELSSARRDLGGRPSLRKGPVAVPRETDFLPQRESLEDEPPSSAVHERMNFLRSEFEDSPISRGSQESLAALREEFRRKHVTSDEAPGGGFALPSIGGPKIARIALVAVALIAGGLAAWLALGRQPEPAPAPVVEQVAPPPAPPMVEVLVARAAIPVGTRLSPDLLEWQKWPEATIRTEYLTIVAMPEAMTELNGAVARTELLAGEPVRRERLGQAGAGYLSAILEPGKRAVSVGIDARSASGGFVMPNDRVDVVLTSPATNGLSSSRTILENVRVLAINSNLGATEAEAAAASPSESRFADSALATLELDQTQAELIINAANGHLSLVLRPTTDTTAPADAERQAVNQSIRLTSPFWLETQQSASSGTAAAYPGM